MRWLLFPLFMVLAAATTTLSSDLQPAEVKSFLHSRQVLGTVQFAEGSAVLNKPAKREIDRIILSLRQVDGKKHTIRIEGFASPSGTDEVNVTISMMRAKAVVDYIRKRHKFKNDLYLTGYGIRADGDHSENAKARAEIAVYDETWDSDQIVEEKSIIR